MQQNSKYEKLFEPGYIGGVKFRNRIIKTAAQTCLYQEEDGCREPGLIAYAVADGARVACEI